VAGRCSRCDKPLVCIKCGEFCDQLRNFHLTKNNCAVWHDGPDCHYHHMGKMRNARSPYTTTLHVYMHVHTPACACMSVVF
jgi:hypothetical protein